MEIEKNTNERKGTLKIIKGLHMKMKETKQTKK